MTFPVVSIAVGASDHVSPALDRAAAGEAAGARLVEWRLDELAMEPSPMPAIERLLREAPAPCIVTIRPTWEGGAYDGAEIDRAELFTAVLQSDAQPRYIDVELKAWRDDHALRSTIAAALQSRAEQSDQRPGLILSSHDFQQRPPDLLQRVEQMTAEPMCDVIKLAWHARSLRDNLQALELLRERSKPTIALCMGPFGLPSRVLAPKFGGFATFVAADEDQATAPGQPTIEQLIGLYRFNKIGPDTSVFGVIGWPVEHSKSPAIHNAGFSEIDFDGVYLPLPVPLEFEHFKATLTSLLDPDWLGYRGCSVTIPHKSNLIEFAHNLKDQGHRVEIEALSEQIGAANTLAVDDDRKLRIFNTDAPAVANVLARAIAQSRTSSRIGAASAEASQAVEASDTAIFKGRKVAVLGAGGAARAAAAACASAGADVAIFNRTQDKARALAAELSQQYSRDQEQGRGQNRGRGRGRVVPGKQGRVGCGCFDVIINCTSVGMATGPAPDQSPLDLLCDSNRENNALGPDVIVFDTVYAPLETRLVIAARAAGATVITGDAMFIEQASMQFQQWTGQPLPRAVAADQ